ncbi:MAG: polysaccharide biosynthesis C-terminal domain-containing protein [Ignavibacteriales bacterium]|nr:polysaccharide biosynthesis C-terminal domain-containing protein [Ignavibacteriales bacterium]
MIEKIKELTKDTAIYGISTIIGRFLGFFLVPFYTNVINTHDFGIYSNIYAYLAFLNIVFIYGMDAAFMKYASLNDKSEKKRIFSTAYLFVFLTSIVLSVFLYLLKTPLSHVMEIPAELTKLYYYLILILIFDTLAIVPFANLRLERKAGKFTAIKLTNILLNISLNFILVLKYKMGIEAIFIANLIASAFSFFVFTPDIFKMLHLKIDKELLVKYLKFGLPYLPASMAAMIVQVVDRPVVLAMTNESTLGIYQANYKLGIFMMLFASMFQFAWQPFFLTNAKEKNAKELFAKVLTLFVIVSSLIWIILTLFVEDFARFQFLPGKSIIGKEYLSGITIVPIILLAYLFNGIYYNFQAGIYIEEKTKYFPYVTGAGAVVNVVVNILLIPLLGIIGAALATLASYIVMAAGLYFFSQKYYPIKYEFGKIFKILGLISITCLLYYYLYYQVGLNFFYKIFLLAGFVLSLLVMKVVEKNEIIRLVKMLFRVK